MNILSIIKSSKFIIICIVCCTLMFGINSTFKYITALQSNLAILELNNQTLKASIRIQNITLLKKDEEIKEIKKINANFTKTIKTQDDKIVELNKKFTESSNGNSRDIGKLALQKTSLVQTAINTATSNVNRCYEILSGSAIKEDETNSECPELFK